MRYILILLLSLGLMACDETPQTGGTTTLSGDQADAKARGMIRLVSNSASFKSLPQSCPLAVYKTKVNVSGTVPDCFKNPRQCMTLCEAGNRRACFDAAQVIEKGRKVADSRATYRLYMDGCARGDGNACVNAGATVKNTVWSNKPPAAGTAQCQFKTYKRMCNDGAAWGCYMVAQEYLRTDGHAPFSKAKHDRFMRQACKVSRTSGACTPGFK